MASRVDALLGGGDFDALAGHLDALELETGASADWPWAAHVLAHVALGNLDHARFVYQRAPEDAKEEGSELDAALAVLQCAWQRDHAGVHAAVASGAWSPRVAPLVRHVAARYRANTLELMSRAYTSVSVSHVVSCLGVTEQEAEETAAGLKWTLDPAARVFEVVKPEPTEKQRAVSMDVLQRLTEYTVHLAGPPDEAA
jgi:COP9 signalosome complex subunit 8